MNSSCDLKILAVSVVVSPLFLDCCRGYIVPLLREKVQTSNQCDLKIAVNDGEGCNGQVLTLCDQWDWN